jgi:membrane protease YdiL (CAAX protease family)
MTALAEAMVIGFSLVVIRLVVGREWKRRLALRRPALAHVLLVVVGIPALVMVADGGYAALKHVLPSFADWGLPDITEIIKQCSNWPWTVGVLVIGLGPGIGEELWCRGFLGNGLVGRHGYLAGVLFTSFFFGLIHVDPPHAAIAMLLGIVLHFVYLTTRSLWAPMLLHFLNNSLAVVASSNTLPENAVVGTFKGILDRLEQAEKARPAALFATGALLLGAVALALYRSRARLASSDEANPSLWRPAYPGVEWPPGASGTVVVRSPIGISALAVVVVALALFWGVVYRASLL